MAKFLPYENYTIKSSLNKEKLLIKLFAKTLSVKEFVNESDKRVFTFGIKAWSKPYWGYLKDESFELERLITYRNFANLKMIGSFKQTPYGTGVQIKIKPPDSTLIIVGLFLLAFLYGLIKIAIQSVRQNEILPEVFIAGGMIIFAYLLLLASFKSESVKTKGFWKIYLKQLVNL